MERHLVDRYEPVPEPSASLQPSPGGWDLVYQYDYAATDAQQKTGWVGSWAPIVETFQSLYVQTNPMGALDAQLISSDSNGVWGTWELLPSSDSYLRTDNVGFNLVFLDPNYAFIVSSSPAVLPAERRYHADRPSAGAAFDNRTAGQTFRPDCRHARCFCPQETADRRRPRPGRAFIDGKTEMIRRDPYLTDAEKAAAIADLEARR